MNEMLEGLRHKELWTISVQRLILYVVFVGVYFTWDAIWRKLMNGQKAKVAEGKGGACVLVALSAALGGFVGAAGLAFLAPRLGETPRLAQILVPLALLLEKHTRGARATPDLRRWELLGAAGLTSGTLGALYVFMRAAPLK